MGFAKNSDLDAIKSNNTVAKRHTANNKVNSGSLGGEDNEQRDSYMKEYDYLLNMPLSSLTTDKIDALNDDATQTTRKLQRIKNTSPSDLWMEDLDRLEPHL